MNTGDLARHHTARRSDDTYVCAIVNVSLPGRRHLEWPVFCSTLPTLGERQGSPVASLPQLDFGVVVAALTNVRHE